jgi:hypothetical protein
LCGGRRRKHFFCDRLVCTKIARIFTVNGSCGSTSADGRATITLLAEERTLALEKFKYAFES